MRFTRTLSYEHQAKKKQYGEKDIPDKFKIIMWMYEKFGLIGITGEAIPIPNSTKSRLPDIIIPQKNIVIELDGPQHQGWDEVTKLEQDKDRDRDYKEAGYKIVIINYELTDGYKQNLVMIELEKQLQ